jgi:hypothetical protein
MLLEEVGCWTGRVWEGFRSVQEGVHVCSGGSWRLGELTDTQNGEADWERLGERCENSRRKVQPEADGSRSLLFFVCLFFRRNLSFSWRNILFFGKTLHELGTNSPDFWEEDF